MSFDDVSLNGTVQVIPSLLEEAPLAANDPESITCEPQTTVDDSDKVARLELEKKNEELEKKEENFKKKIAELEKNIEGLEKKNEDFMKKDEDSKKEIELRRQMI